MVSTAPDRPAVVAVGLGRRYGDIAALEDLTLRVEPGEVVALLGANGSGKTTALRCMAGDLQPTAGEVRIFGADPHREQESETARRTLALVPDTPVFYRDLTVAEHVALVAAAHDDPEGVRRGERVLAELGLEGRRDARPAHLSSGQRQKALLACIAARPFDVLLLDEPVLRLDPASQAWLRERLAEHARDGVAVILTTHQPSFAAGLADRAVLLAEGRLALEQPFDEFLDSGGAARIGAGAAEPDDAS